MPVPFRRSTPARLQVFPAAGANTPVGGRAGCRRLSSGTPPGLVAAHLRNSRGVTCYSE